MSTTSASTKTRKTYAARLFCGTVLTYEAASFVPLVGDIVPCRRHGFCTVESTDEGDGRDDGNAHREPRRAHQAPRRRSQGELVAFLRTHSVTSIHTLRRHRFTLRVVAAAQKEGLVHVDLVAGRVVLGRQAPGG